jgi:hypothetical protein
MKRISDVTELSVGEAGIYHIGCLGKDRHDDLKLDAIAEYMYQYAGMRSPTGGELAWKIKREIPPLYGVALTQRRTNRMKEYQTYDVRGKPTYYSLPVYEYIAQRLY